MEERQNAKAPKELWEEPSDDLDGAVRRVIGAAIEVHRTIGPGFPEIVYERALCIELRLRGIPFEQRPMVNVTYKGFVVGKGQLDLIADDIVLELKAVYMLLPVHRSQLHSYLKASGHQIGLLLNFETPTLTIRRVINSKNS
jgi:GxxExxY protein